MKTQGCLLPSARSRFSPRRRPILATSIALLVALIVVPERARAQAFNATPATVAGSVTYNRAAPLGPNTEIVTINTVSAGILWTPSAVPPAFLPNGSTAYFQGAPGNDNYSVYNRIAPTGGGTAIQLEGTVIGRTSATDPVSSGLVAFYSPDGFVVETTAQFNLGRLWFLNDDETNPTLLITWSGTLDAQAPAGFAPIPQTNVPGDFPTYAAGPSNPVPARPGLTLTYADFSAVAGSLGGGTGSSLDLVSSTFRLGGTTLSLATVEMTDSTFTYVEGAANATRTLSQSVILNSAETFEVMDSRELTLTGVVSGAGDLSKTGLGTLTLTDENTYTGGTTITSGTLQIGNGGATGSIAADVVNNAALIVNRTGEVTLGGVISGAGTLTKQGAGTLALTEANTYTGSTTITAGTLLANNAAGSATGTGAVAVTGRLGGSGAVTGPVTLNSGGFIAPGAVATGVSVGTLTTGALTWNGGGTLSLQLGASDAASDLLAINGALTKGTAGAYTVDIADAGALGTQSLYTLATFIGTTFTLADFTLALPLGFTATLALDGDSLDLLLTASPASGRVIQNSAGTPTTADFTVNGPVTTGTPTENNTIRSLIFTPESSLNIFNTLTVTQGPVNLVPGSSMNLGTSPLGNATLSASQLNVQNGSSLTGNGTINGNLVNSGLVSPGNSPGSIYVSQNYTQTKDGTLRIEIAGTRDGEFDLLAVRGTAELDGKLELIRLDGFKLKRGDKITFLTADGGVNGEFATVESDFTRRTILTPEVIYEDNAVSLELVRGSFAEYAQRWGLTPNQRAVAKALDTLSENKPNDQALVYLDRRALAKLPGDFDKIAPEELTSVFTISTSLANVQGLNLQRRADGLRNGAAGFSAGGLSMQGSGPGYSGGLFASGNTSLFGGGAAGPTGEGKESKEPSALDPENKWGVFLTGVGEWVDVDGDGNARGYDITTGGFTLGLDYKVSPNFAIGVAAGYAGTAADLTDDGRVWVNGGKLGLYATYFQSHGAGAAGPGGREGKGSKELAPVEPVAPGLGGTWYADLAVTGGYNSYDTKRSGLGGIARGETEGGELNVLVGTGYDLKLGALTIGPTATFQYTLVGLDGFTERGSLAPLDIESREAESIRTAVGLKASYDWRVGGILVKPEVRAAWQHEFADKSYDLSASYANGSGDNFLVNGPELGRDSLLLGAGVAVQFNERTTAYLYYDGELFREEYQRHSVSGGIRVAF